MAHNVRGWQFSTKLSSIFFQIASQLLPIGQFAARQGGSQGTIQDLRLTASTSRSMKPWTRSRAHLSDIEVGSVQVCPRSSQRAREALATLNNLLADVLWLSTFIESSHSLVSILGWNRLIITRSLDRKAAINVDLHTIVNGRLC
jgi:hypothetical protein